MLYVLDRPDGSVALLRLADLDRWTSLDARMRPLRRSRGVSGTPAAEVRVIAAASACGAVYELEIAERLLEGEDVASERLAAPVSGTGASGWFAPPRDWAARLRREDCGLFRAPYPLTRLRDRGHLPRPTFPSDRGPALRPCRSCRAGWL